MCNVTDGVDRHIVFFDVGPEYSPEEIAKYKHFAGISQDSHEEEILQKLKEERASKVSE